MIILALAFACVFLGALVARLRMENERLAASRALCLAAMAEAWYETVAIHPTLARSVRNILGERLDREGVPRIEEHRRPPRYDVTGVCARPPL